MIWSNCEACKKKKLWVKNRNIMLPIGQEALSKKKICRRCQKVVQKAIQIHGK